MHAKEELAEKIGETYGYLSEIIDHKVEAAKLSIAEKSALAISKVLMGVVLSIFGGSAALFGLIAFAFWLAGLDGTARGFGIVALIMLAILLIVFLLRRVIIINPAVTKVIALFFSDKPSSANHE